MTETARVSDDDATIVPRDLVVTALAGGNGVLEVVALTLRRGPSRTELYAALKNVGDRPACTAAFSVELFDREERSLAVGITGLLTKRFYRIVDGSESIAACVGPGDVTMAAITDLPSEIAISEVGTVLYRCPYIALDVAPLAGLTIEGLRPVTNHDGVRLTGKLVNELEVTVKNPSVTVFAVNRAGRPLGVAHGSGSVSVAPGGSWAFETNPTELRASDYAAYPAGALEQGERQSSPPR